MKEATRQRILTALKNIIGDIPPTVSIETIIPEEVVSTLNDDELKFYLQHELLHLSVPILCGPDIEGRVDKCPHCGKRHVVKIHRNIQDVGGVQFFTCPNTDKDYQATVKVR
jgi:hypothetical protein